jgi:hypothetical protein
MLSGLLDKMLGGARALHHQDPAVRLKFLVGLDAERATELQPRLLELLAVESDASVRAAALPHINGVDALITLFRQREDLRAEIAEWIATRKAPDISLCQSHPDIARARLLHTDADAEQNALLGLITSDEELIELALKARAPLKAKILDLPRFANESAWATLEHLSRGRDKSVNRHARERLDAIRTIDETLKGLKDRAQSVHNAVATLSRQQPEGPAARESRRRQLISLQNELQSLIERESAALAAALAAGAQRNPGITSAAFEGLDLEAPPASPFVQLLAAVRPAAALLTGADIATVGDTVRHELAQLQARWEECKAIAAPATDETRRFAAIEEAYAAVLAAVGRFNGTQWPSLVDPGETIPDGDTRDFWREVSALRRNLERHARATKELAWPANLEEPEPLKTTREQAVQRRERLSRLDVAHAALHEAITATLGEARTLVDAGQSKQAQSKLVALRRDIQRLRPESSQKLRSILDALFHQLGELKDWQTFATGPKREALLASMKELVGIDLDPEQLSTRIRRVRDAWNDLGAPVNRHEHALRDEFEAAAAQAFEPCRRYFAEQDQVRAQNLGKRQELTTMLRGYLDSTDWNHADFNAAEKILQTARREWQAAFPLPRGDHREVTQAFESIQESLHAKVHARYQAASDRKRALIDTLLAARTTTPVPDQVELVKRLQGEWKAAGPGVRHLEQPLWREFREVCDAVFKDRTQALEEEKVARNAVLSAAAEQNRQFAATLAAWTEENASPAALRDARSAFSALGELGRDGRGLVDEHRQLLREGEAKLATFAVTRRRQRLERIRAIDVALDRGETVAIEPKLEGYFQPRTAATAENVQELVLLAEIAAGNETPQEEQRQRMSIQVDLMNRRATKPDQETLLLRWCRLADKHANETQRARFFSALARLD